MEECLLLPASNPALRDFHLCNSSLGSLLRLVSSTVLCFCGAAGGVAVSSAASEEEGLIPGGGVRL